MVQHGVVSLLGFGWRDVADGLQQPPVVEPVHPFQRCKLDSLEGSPWPASMDHLGFVKPVDRFGERIVIAVADVADRWLNARLREALGIFDRQILGGFNWP